jgi:hypothetical protein
MYNVYILQYVYIIHNIQYIVYMVKGMKTITDFYAAWDAAIGTAFLEDHASTLRQISKFFDVSSRSRQDMCQEVSNFTVYLRRLHQTFVEEYSQYKILLNLVATGVVSRSLLAPLADKDLNKIERPVVNHLFER